MTPTWTILIATLGQRTDRFARLLDGLLPQLDEHHGAVTICAFFNNGEYPLGQLRHTLINDATSTYVSFVDDDDVLPDYYVSRIVPLLDGVDYVGWRMQCYVDNVMMKPTYHSIRYPQWYDDRRGYYRDVSHLNPIRTELARRGDFRRGDPPEDVAWADQLRGIPKTEHYIDDIMYHYHSSTVDSTWRPDSVQRRSYVRHTVDHPYFSYHPEST